MSTATGFTPAGTPTDRFGRAFRNGARIVYPTRRGSNMDVIEATVTGHDQVIDYNTWTTITVLYATRKNGAKVTLRNLFNAVIVP